MIKQINRNIDKIESLLINQPELKDNDNRLIAVFWALEIGLDKLNGMSAADFFGTMSEGKLTSSETIRRCRQKLQEENENLRGSKYNDRLKRAEAVRIGINECKECKGTGTIIMQEMPVMGSDGEMEIDFDVPVNCPCNEFENH